MVVLLVLGVAFELAGAGVTLAVILGKVDASLLPMSLTFLVVGLIQGMIGLVGVRAAARRRHILTTGLPGTAVITSVRQTGASVNDQPVIAIELSVRLPGRTPYTARLRQVVPLIRLGMVQPGLPLAVRVDRERRDRVAIDWDAPQTVSAGVGPLTPTIGPLVAQVAGLVRAAAAGPPDGITLPSLPPQDTGATEEQLRAQVRGMGATGRAIVDDVRVVGPRPDGRMGYQLSMWVQLDSGPAYRVENAPVGVDLDQTHHVVPGVTVPLRAAQAAPGVTMTVLEWDRL